MMKINCFVRFMVLISCFNIWANLKITSKELFSEDLESYSIVKEDLVKRFKSDPMKAEAAFQRLKDIILKSDNLRAVAFDKSYLVLVSDSSIKLFNLDDNMIIINEVETTDFNHVNITSMAISSIEQKMVAVNYENDIFLFDVRKNRIKLIDTYLGDGKIASFVAFSPDGSKLAVVNYESNIINLFGLNDAILSKTHTIFTEIGSGPLTAQFSENGNHIAILCKKQNSIKVFSYHENDWKLTESHDITNNQFLYFFDGNRLIIDYREIVNPGIENKRTANTVDNVAMSKSLELEQKVILEDPLPVMNGTQSKMVDIHNNKNINLTLLSKNRTLTKTSRPIIKGKTAPNQKVQIYMNDSFLDEVISNKSGNFSFRVKNSLPNGSYKFNAKIQLEETNVSSDFINFRINKHYPLKGSKSKGSKRKKR